MDSPSAASRKRSVSCREDDGSGMVADGTWEPAHKRLRTLVRQMRSLSLGDLPWPRRKAKLTGQTDGIDRTAAAGAAPPTPTPTSTPAQRRANKAAVTDPGQPTAAGHKSQTAAAADAGSAGPSHTLKRTDKSDSGSAAKKARHRMRGGPTGVVMTCYIEQTLYT